jgi:hypothetical protein
MSETAICQLATAHLRAGTIGSIDDNSIAATHCKLFYETLRDVVLEGSNWGFARKVKPLQLLSETEFGWTYAYQYPSDCLRVNKLMINYETSAQDDVVYCISNINGAKVILSNEPGLRISYRSRVTNTDLFPASFKMALSYLIASEIAVAVIGVKEGERLKKISLNMYASYLGSASENDANEEQNLPQESEYVTARN